MVGTLIIKVLWKVFLPEEILGEFLGLHRLNLISKKNIIVIVFIFGITMIAFEDLYLTPQKFS